MTAVILFTTAGIAVPLFIIIVVVVLIPWLLWGVSFTTERLHDRDRSAWWLVVFYVLPAVLGQFAKLASRSGEFGAALHFVLALTAFALTIWGFVEIGCLRGTAGTNSYGPDPLLQSKRHGRTDLQKRKKARRPSGHRALLAIAKENCVLAGPRGAPLRLQETSTVATIPKTPASASAAMRASS